MGSVNIYIYIYIFCFVLFCIIIIFLILSLPYYKNSYGQNKTKNIYIYTPHPLYFLTFLFYFPSSSESAGQQLPGSTSLKMILIFCGHSGEGCENSDGMFLGVDSLVQQPRPSHLQTRAAWCSQNLGKR